MTELLFVYNADSGLLNGAVDFFHKIISPSTYACSLCAVTYGTQGMRAEWKEFVAELPVNTTFLHRDELHKMHSELAHHPLPAAFHRNAGGSWNVFLTNSELDRSDLPALMHLVRNRLEADALLAAAQRPGS